MIEFGVQQSAEKAGRRRSAPRAAIAWRDVHGCAPPPEIRSVFLEAHYELVDDNGASGSRPADLGLIDARGATPAAAGDLQSESFRAGSVILSDRTLNADERRGLSRLGDVAYAAADGSISPAYVAALARERLRLAALAEEAGERLKSLAAYGAAAPPLGSVRDAGAPLRLLIAGEARPAMLDALAGLRAHGAAGACVFTAAQAMRALDRGRFDAALFAPAGDRDVLLSLANALRRHRVHKSTPILVLDRDDSDVATTCARKGLRLVCAEHLAGDLAWVARAVAERAASVAALSKSLRGARDAAAAAGGEAGFFAAHGARLATRAQIDGRIPALIVLKVAATRLGAARADFDPVDMARDITRATDFCARLAPDLVGVLLPGARVADAERVAGRLEGVARGLVAGDDGDEAVAARAFAVDPHAPFEESLFKAIAGLPRLRFVAANDAQ